MLLDENSREFDLFDISSLVDKFLTDLDSISGSRMIALVGAYGSGKSTYLNIIKSRLESNTHKWLEFDAWKYPDKRDIWEGFVLDVSEQIEPLSVKDVSDKIDGIPTRKDNLVKTLLESFNLFLTSQGIPLAGQAMTKVGLLRNSSPANRVNDFQRVLKHQIESLPQPTVCIVVEDVDRSGTYGTIFLEAVRSFLDTIDLKKRVIFIVPIGSTTYLNKFHEYEKFIDMFSFFELKPDNYTTFLENIVREELCSNDELNALTKLFQGLMRDNLITVRTIKLALRSAHLSFISHSARGFKPNFAMEIAVQLMRFVFYPNESVEVKSSFERIRLGAWSPGHIREIKFFETFLTDVLSIDSPEGLHKIRVVENSEYHHEAQNAKFVLDKPLIMHLSTKNGRGDSMYEILLPIYYADL